MMDAGVFCEWALGKSGSNLETLVRTLQMTIVFLSTHLYTLKQSQLQRMTYVG